MIKIKNTIKWSLVLCLLFVFSGVAQVDNVVKVPLSKPGSEGKLILSLIEGSITVEGHSSEYVLVEAIKRSRNSNWKNKNKNKNKQGLRRIEENSLSFSIEENNNVVHIKSKVYDGTVDYIIKVPKNFSVKLKATNNGLITVNGLNGTHEVSNLNGEIKMYGVGGSVIADALNENITVQFESIYNDTAMMFTSLNGDIDVSFPSDLKANVMARSDNGNVYTDFEMEASKADNRVEGTGSDGVYRVTQKKGVSGKINGGGIDINFKTLNGDILIRSNQ